MRTSTRSVSGSCVIAALLCLAAGTAAAQSAAEATPVLAKVINDRELFGDDGIAAIRAASAWRGAVKRFVIVEPAQVVADQPVAEVDAAAVSDLQSRTTQASAGAPAARASTFRAVVVFMPEDGTRRLALRRDNPTFLKTGIKLAVIEQRYGKPQRVFTEIMESQGERRPAILTIYEYDGGAVRFASSDFSRFPGSVDRVFLDLAALERALADNQG
jgi:hypothetical protein